MTLFVLANQTIIIEKPRPKVEEYQSLWRYYLRIRPQLESGSACRGVRFNTLEDWADVDNYLTIRRPVNFIYSSYKSM